MSAKRIHPSAKQRSSKGRPKTFRGRPSQRETRPGNDCLAGPHALEACFTSGRKVLRIWAARHESVRLQPLLERAEELGVEVQRVSSAELEARMPGVRHQGVLFDAAPYAYCELESLLAECNANSVLLALDQVTDPRNFGSIIRSAVAFGVLGIVVTKRRTASVGPLVSRTSVGAVEYARIAQVTNLARTLRALRDEGFWIGGLAAEGNVELNALEAPTRPRVLVVGSEGDGMRRLVQESCEDLIRIPMPGPVPSLNASVAAAIAMQQLCSLHS